MTVKLDKELCFAVLFCAAILNYILVLFILSNFTQTDSPTRRKPLGLKINKTPEFIAKLEKAQTEAKEDGRHGRIKMHISQPDSVRHKVCRFPVSKLQIGSWEVN